jgi:hypothetical protein
MLGAGKAFSQTSVHHKRRKVRKGISGSLVAVPFAAFASVAVAFLAEG